MSNKKTAIVVGAGLSGLSAAYQLAKNGWQVNVLEVSDYAGGRVQTIHKDGYIIDTGASALATSYVSYIALAKELGIATDIVDVNPQVGIYRNGHIYTLNLRKMLASAVNTKLFSWSAKIKMLRLMLDVWRGRHLLDYDDMSKSAPLDNESARDYAMRTLGSEISDYLCDPLTRIMLIADSDKVSRVELFSGIANIFGTRMQALKGGGSVFAQRLAEHLDISYHSEVTQVKDYHDHIEVSWRNAEGVEQQTVVDACVVACQLPVARQICVDYQPLLAPLDNKLEYTSAITVAIGTKVKPKSGAFVIPLPACESPDIALLFLEHNKCKDRTPDGRYMINAHWETDASKEHLDAADEFLVAKSMETILKLFPELEGSIDTTYVARWPRALPKTSPGIYKAIGQFNKVIDTNARVQFAADYLSAAGQNTAVSFGMKAANNLINQ